MDNNIRDEVSLALRNAKEAFEALASVLNTAMAKLNDVIEENQRLHDTNNRLNDDNTKYREENSRLRGELYNAQRQAEATIREKDTEIGSLKLEIDQGNRKFESMERNLNEKAELLQKLLDEAKADGVRLREIILNVAASVDNIVNPKAVAETPKTPEPVTEPPKAQEVPSSEPSREPYGSPFPAPAY